MSRYQFLIGTTWRGKRGYQRDVVVRVVSAVPLGNRFVVTIVSHPSPARVGKLSRLSHNTLLADYAREGVAA